MWIVRNLLRGTLTFRGIGISIAPKGEYDLDALGRARAEGSNQIAVAFEEGYLANVFKDSMPGGGTGEPLLTDRRFDEGLERFKASILGEIRTAVTGGVAGAVSAVGAGAGASDPGGRFDVKQGLVELRSSLSNDVRDMLAGLKVAKLRLREEKERVLVDATLSEAEIKARLAFLEEKEREVEKNFHEIGRKTKGEAVATGRDGGASVLEKADLLSSI